MSILLYFFFLFPLILILLQNFKPSKWNLPPGPPKLPIIGNLHQRRELRPRNRRNLAEKYGPVVLLRFGFVPVVVISSRDAAEEVLKIHDLECCSRPETVGTRTISYNCKGIGFMPYGEEWKAMRKLAVIELFSMKKLQSFRYIREEESDLFPGRFGRFIDRISGQNKRLESLFSEVDIFLQNILDDHLKPGRRRVEESSDTNDVMIDMMRKQDKDGDSFKPTTDNLKGMISDIFIAGVNTSASTMIWAMTELTRNRRVMKKVQDEIRTTLGNKKERITEQDVTKLHYFKLMVKETLRLHPAAPLLLPRETLTHIKIQGYDIPPKTKILINAYAIARDPKLWTDPDEFNPDRFLDSCVDYKGLNFELLPFGSGRRVCPGMALGVAMVELGLLNMLYFFDWGLPEKEEANKITTGNDVALDLFQVLHH